MCRVSGHQYRAMSREQPQGALEDSVSNTQDSRLTFWSIATPVKEGWICIPCDRVSDVLTFSSVDSQGDSRALCNACIPVGGSYPPFTLTHKWDSQEGIQERQDAEYLRVAALDITWHGAWGK